MPTEDRKIDDIAQIDSDSTSTDIDMNDDATETTVSDKQIDNVGNASDNVDKEDDSKVDVKKAIDNNDSTKKSDSSNPDFAASDSDLNDNAKSNKDASDEEQKASSQKVPFIDRFSRPCKSRSNVSVMLVAIAVIVAFASVYVTQAYDNDMWFIISSGREIVEHGIPMTNVFTWLPNLSTVIQQWLPDVLTYLTYANFGVIGICVFVAIEIAALVLSLLYLSKKASGGKIPYETSLILIAASIPALGAYISIRPQILTMIGITWTLIFLESYRHTNNWKWLIGLPITMIVHINCHMAMAPFDLFVIFMYLIPDVTKAVRQVVPSFTYSFRDSSYSRKPLLIAFIVTCAAMLLNPYGINGAMYLVSSYGAADYGNYIKEMGALTPWDSDYGMGMVLLTFIGAMAIGRNRRKINFPGTMLLIACTFLSYQHVRNVWLGALLALPLAFQAFANVGFGTGKSVDNPDPILADSVMWRVICGAFAIVAASSCIMTSVSNADINIDADSTSTPKNAMDWLNENHVSKNAKVFNHFNSGGYIEWRGYKAFIDARPELFEPAITGVDKHYYKDYVDTSTGKYSYDDMLSKYAFDFLIVNDDTNLYDSLMSNKNYLDVCNGNGYALFKRIGTTTVSTTTTDLAANHTGNSATSVSPSVSAAIESKKSLLPAMNKCLD